MIEFIEKLGPTIVGIVALWVSYLITQRQIQSSAAISKHQIRASTISTTRIQWIETLQDNLAKVIAMLSHTSGDLSDDSGKVRIDETMSETMVVAYRIMLMLDPKDALHLKLIEEISAFQRWSIKADMKTASKQYGSLLVAARNVIDAEWSRVMAITHLENDSVSTGTGYFIQDGCICGSGSDSGQWSIHNDLVLGPDGRTSGQWCIRDNYFYGPDASKSGRWYVYQNHIYGPSRIMPWILPKTSASDSASQT